MEHGLTLSPAWTYFEAPYSYPTHLTPSTKPLHLSQILHTYLKPLKLSYTLHNNSKPPITVSHTPNVLHLFQTPIPVLHTPSFHMLHTSPQHSPGKMASSAAVHRWRGKGQCQRWDGWTAWVGRHPAFPAALIHTPEEQDTTQLRIWVLHFYLVHYKQSTHFLSGSL